MRLWIALSFLLALAACAGSPPRSGLSFTGVTPSAPAESDESACPDAAFPGGASLDNERDGAMTFFCEH